jgi:hypothetical protein
MWRCGLCGGGGVCGWVGGQYCTSAGTDTSMLAAGRGELAARHTTTHTPVLTGPGHAHTAQGEDSGARPTSRMPTTAPTNTRARMHACMHAQAQVHAWHAGHTHTHTCIHTRIPPAGLCPPCRARCQSTCSSGSHATRRPSHLWRAGQRVLWGPGSQDMRQRAVLAAGCYQCVMRACSRAPHADMCGPVTHAGMQAGRQATHTTTHPAPPIP